MSSMEIPDKKRSRQYIHIDVLKPQADVLESQADVEELQADVQELQVQGPPPDVQLHASSKIKIKLVSEGNVQKASILKFKHNQAPEQKVIVTWIIDVGSGDCSDLTKMEFELYDRRHFHLPQKLLIGGKKSMKMSDLVEGTRTSTISVLNNAQSEICTLNAYRINIKEAVGDGVNATNEPRTPSEGAEEVLKILQVAVEIFDAVSAIHPIARVTWGILSFGLKTYTKQTETDKLVLKLCGTMKSIHEEANSKHALQKQEDLTEIYNSMFEKTFECCVFINHYVKKGFFGRLFILNASGKVADYQEVFSDFKEALSSALAKDTNDKVNKIHDKLETKKLLKTLKPKLSLGPKCRCLERTRVKTIEILDSWIKDGHPDKRVLWCSGLAGTGKSSLAGTLHAKLVEGDRLPGRLGAFIRYDRAVQSPDMSIACLIQSIAFSLGQLDDRIGCAIAKVIHDSPGIQNTPAKTQYEKLLYEPLKSVQELVQEGPLVVIIDGLDECRDLVISNSRSDGSDAVQQGSHDSSQVPQGDPTVAREVLAVLSEGFQDLMFMRLILFSRRVNPITVVFEKQGSIVDSLLLNKSLDPIHDDIQLVINNWLKDIGDESPDFRNVLRCYPDAAKDLASKANGLFIWATIACRYLGICQSKEVLVQLLSIKASDNVAEYSEDNNWEAEALEGLHHLYISALNQAAGRTQYVRNCIMKVLGAIIVAWTPPGLTLDDLDKLVLGSGEISAKDILDKLGSVVETNTEQHGFIRLIHKSFDDFLTHQSLHHKDSWFINIEDHKRKFAQQCLSVLTNFLKKWAEGSNIPSHIQNYALLGPLWHIEWFDKSDVKDLCILFEADLSAKWCKVVKKVGKKENLLWGIIKVLHWVNSLKGIDFNFCQLIYHACQRAEFALLSTEGQPTIELQNVFWHNILSFGSHWPSITQLMETCFSVSADSQVLIATTKDHTNILSWDINVHIQEEPALKPASSFFNLEESLPALKDPHYCVLGHLVVCQSMFVDDLPVDDLEACWKVIDNGLSVAQSEDQSASAFISISDIQTFHCHHYLFKDLKHYHLLLYTAGFIIINTQTMVLMKIDVNAATDQHEWKYIMEGDALQGESLSIPHVGQGSPLLVVSQDGSTLAHLSWSVDGPGDFWMLQCWDTTTGFLTYSSTLNIHQQKPMSLILSASGTTSIIITSEGQETSEGRKTSLHIVPFDNGGAVYGVIDRGNLPLSQGTFQVVVSFPDKQKIAYLMKDAMVIRDIQAKKDIFHHHFSSYHQPSNIMITPDGKTLITVHPFIRVIRTWHIEGL